MANHRVRQILLPAHWLPNGPTANEFASAAGRWVRLIRNSTSMGPGSRAMSPRPSFVHASFRRTNFPSVGVTDARYAGG